MQATSGMQRTCKGACCVGDPHEHASLGGRDVHMVHREPAPCKCSRAQGCRCGCNSSACAACSCHRQQRSCSTPETCNKSPPGFNQISAGPAASRLASDAPAQLELHLQHLDRAGEEGSLATETGCLHCIVACLLLGCCSLPAARTEPGKLSINWICAH